MFKGSICLKIDLDLWCGGIQKHLGPELYYIIPVLSRVFEI